MVTKGDEGKINYEFGLNVYTLLYKSFPGSSLPAIQDTWVQSWVGKIPKRRKWQPTPVFLPGESHGQRRLAGYNLWDRRELETTEVT